MRSTPSVHDNVIYAYSVDCEGQRLVLHTTYRDREPQEWTDIMFSGVVAHQFEHVLPGNILFDVEEADVAMVVKDNAQLLADSWRYGWPPLEYHGNLDVLVDLLATSSVRAFTIGSSYGLSGWVLARSCERVSRGDAARVA